jgi:hypothetical protein
VGGGVQLGPLGPAAINKPIVPAPGDYDDGEIGGIIGRGNGNTRRKPAPVPLCVPQTPHAARTRTRAAAVGSQRLTAWATARPLLRSWDSSGYGWRRQPPDVEGCCRHFELLVADSPQEVHFSLGRGLRHLVKKNSMFWNVTKDLEVSLCRG